MAKIHIVGIDPFDESWQGLYDLLENEVEKQTVSYSICPYNSSVTEEQIADCNGIIYLDMQPVITEIPHVQLTSGESFSARVETLLKKLHDHEVAVVDEELARIAEETTKKSRKKRSTLATAFLLIAILMSLAVTAFSAWTMFTMTQTLPEAADPFPGQPKDVAVCLGNILEYQLFLQGKVDKPNLLCPASGMEYKFTVVDSNKTVSCPNPEKHDPAIKILRVVGNGKPEVIK